MSITPGCQATRAAAVQTAWEADRVHEVILLTLDACRAPAPALACRDELAAQGATVEIVSAQSDADLDGIIARLDGPARPDGLTWPGEPTWPGQPGPRLVVATAAAGQLRAVLRRMVRRYAPPPSRRPTDLAPDRTLPDLPPVGVLPMYGARLLDLPGGGLPTGPAEVAKAVLHGTPVRLDLLRTDAGSVTLDGTLLGGTAPWAARIEVDDAVLADPGEKIAACAIGNAGGYAELDGLPLVPAADPADGILDVAVAVPVATRRFGRTRVHVEVRRARGRAVSVQPVDEVPFLDDGVAGTLARKRSWWMERGAWAVLRH
jgi:hypothetical protein